MVILELINSYREKQKIVLPLDSNTSAVSRVVNGKSFGTIGRRAFSAKAPCPSSLLPNAPARPVSLVAYGGNCKMGISIINCIKICECVSKNPLSLPGETPQTPLPLTSIKGIHKVDLVINESMREKH